MGQADLTELWAMQCCNLQIGNTEIITIAVIVTPSSIITWFEGFFKNNNSHSPMATHIQPPHPLPTKL
jgi:hypothetical protein